MYYVIVINTVKYVLVILHCTSDIIPGSLGFTECDKK